MAQHASKSPSGAYQWGTCYGSPAMQSTVPEHMKEGSNEYADQGTATHDLVERCLDQQVNPKDFRGRIIELIEDAQGNVGTSMLRKGAKLPTAANRNVFEVDQEMIDGADWMVDYVRRRCEELDIPWDEVKTESRGICLPERDDCWGTVDVTLDAWPEMLEAVDYKNGAGVLVEVKGNRQTRLYLLSKAIESEFSHERYKHTIVQPNMDHPDGKIRSEEMTAEELHAFHKEMLEKAATVDVATAEFEALEENCDDPQTAEGFDEWWRKWLAPSPETCKFCDVYFDCPAVREKAAKQALIDFADDPDIEPDIEVPTQVERVREALAWVPLYEDWIKSLKAFGKSHLEAGGDPEEIGQKFIYGKSSRRWKEGMTPAARLKVIKKLMGPDFVKDKLFTKSEMISGPQAQNLIPKEMKKEFEEKCLFKPEPGLTMVPLSNPKPAVKQQSAVDDFDDDEDFDL